MTNNYQICSTIGQIKSLYLQLAIALPRDAIHCALKMFRIEGVRYYWYNSCILHQNMQSKSQLDSNL